MKSAGQRLTALEKTADQGQGLPRQSARPVFRGQGFGFGV